MKPALLAMTQRLHQEVFEYLFPGDKLESAAILLCNQGTGKHYQRLIATEVLHLPHRLFERKRNFISWPFAEFLSPEKISDVDRRGQSIVTIHSHPSGYKEFSEVDNRNDRQLFPSVCNWFDDQRQNGSAIMLPDGSIIARTVDPNGNFSDMKAVSVVGNDIRIWKSRKPRKETPYQNKLAQTFGSGTLNLLHGMRVGVVGCSGTGSIIIELLVRNCVGELVIVDGDMLEEKNLNRMINSTVSAARGKQSKVSAIKQAIETIR